MIESFSGLKRPLGNHLLKINRLKIKNFILSAISIALTGILFFYRSGFSQSTEKINVATAQQIFDKANQLYQKQEYDSAANLYQQLVNEGYVNPELYYNAGNANYQANHLGYAVYYFEKALQQSPGNAVIENNLSLAKQKAADKIEQIPTLFFIRWWHNMLQFHHPNGWMAGSIIFFWLLIIVTGWRTLRKPAPRWTKWLVVIFAILFCIYLSGAIGSWYHRSHHDLAVIILPEEQVKAAPDSGSADLLVIHEGLKVKITDEVGEWRRIKLSDGREGWILANSMLSL